MHIPLPSKRLHLVTIRTASALFGAGEPVVSTSRRMVVGEEAEWALRLLVSAHI